MGMYGFMYSLLSPQGLHLKGHCGLAGPDSQHIVIDDFLVVIWKQMYELLIIEPCHI